MYIDCPLLNQFLKKDGRSRKNRSSYQGTDANNFSIPSQMGTLNTNMSPREQEEEKEKIIIDPEE